MRSKKRKNDPQPAATLALACVVAVLLCGFTVLSLWELAAQAGDPARAQSAAQTAVVAGACSVVVTLLLLVAVALAFGRERRTAQALRLKDEELRAALQRAEQNSAAKQNFFSRVSHELRTPLNGIIGMAAVGLAHGGNAAKMQDCLQKIDGAAQHLLALVNDVLDLSKIDGGIQLVCRPFALPALLKEVEDIIQPQAAAHGVCFSQQLTALTQRALLGDAMRLRQVLLNLLSNAVKFTPAGGEVCLAVSDLPGVDQTRHRLRFAVTDTGIGMEAEFLQQIFEPFTQADGAGVPGTGLGMPITKKLVEAMGGSITVQSVKGGGTTFAVLLEYPEASEAPEAPPAAAKLDPALRGRRVLLAEDNPLNREVAAELLRLAGVELDTAADGLEAVANFTADPSYDAVLMDVQMPHMNGYDATRAIRAAGGRGADVPILAMTADAFAQDKQKAKDAGMTAHLAKPLQPAALYAALAAALPPPAGQ